MQMLTFSQINHTDNSRTLPLYKNRHKFSLKYVHKNLHVKNEQIEVTTDYEFMTVGSYRK